MLSAELYRYWHVDFQNETIRIVCQDGQFFEEELESRFRTADSQIVSCTFDWEKWWVMSKTTKGDLIITEGFNPISPPPLKGRRSIYLDQNHWRTVSEALHDADRVKDSAERRAAQELIRLANDGAIVLPLSMGHMLETSGLYGDRRYEVGVAMVSLAGGWQIRHPLDVWKHEAELTIRSHLGLMQDAVLHPIVTEPGALFGSDATFGISNETPDKDKFLAMLTMPCVILDTLVDPERIPKDPITQWVDHHARITLQINAQNVSSHQRRRLARRRFWNENIAFFMSPYRRLTRSVDFPMFSDGELEDLLSVSPMVGLLCDLFVRRFTDSRSKWSSNDLIDIFYLSSAAAYTDYVCAEKRTGTQLRDAQRTFGRRETVHTKLDELVEAVRRESPAHER